MTKKEEATSLESLLNSIDNRKSAVVEVDNPAEVKPHEVKRKVVRKRWAGMSVPKPIWEICVYLKSIMEEQGTYSKALDLQLYNIAVQYFAYNELAMQLVDPEEQFKPKAQNLAQIGETLRKALREVAWTRGGCGRNQTIEGPDETPLTSLISAVMKDDSEEMIEIKK